MKKTFMKKSVVAILVFALNSLPAFAKGISTSTTNRPQEPLELGYGGAHGGGGGNAGRSTVEEVQAALGNLKTDAYFLVANLELFGVLDPSRIGDPELSEAAKAMWGGSGESSDKINRLMEIIRNVNFEIRTDRPCPRDGGGHEAWTVNKIGAPICMSASSLTRIPAMVLKEELTALLFHEFSHQFGFDERIARGIQDHIRAKMRTVEALMRISSAESVIDMAKDGFGAGIFDVCLKVGEAAAAMRSAPLKFGVDLSSLDQSEADQLRSTYVGSWMSQNQLDQMPHHEFTYKLGQPCMWTDSPDWDKQKVLLKVAKSIMLSL